MPQLGRKHWRSVGQPQPVLKFVVEAPCLEALTEAWAERWRPRRLVPTSGTLVFRIRPL